MARAVSITERAAGGMSGREEGLWKGVKGAAGHLHQRPASTAAGPVFNGRLCGAKRSYLKSHRPGQA